MPLLSYELFSEKNNIAAIFNPPDQVELWNVVEEVKVARLERPTPHIGLLAISSDRKWVATARQDRWDLWRCDSGEHIRTYITEGIRSIAFSPSGACAVTSAHAGTIKVWPVLQETDVENKPFITADNQVTKLSFVGESSHGYPCRVHVFDHGISHLITGDGQGHLSLWAVPSMRLLRRWQAHTQPVFSAAFSSDDKLLTTSSQDGTAKVWKTDSGELMQTFAGEPKEVLRAVSLSNDSKRLAVGTDAQDTSKGWEKAKFEVRVFDVETGQLLFTTAQGALPISLLAYSPDGKYLVVGRGLSPRYGHMTQGSLNILDAETGQHSFGEITNTATPRYLSFSPDSRYFLIAGQFQALILWDIEEQREVWRIADIDALEAVFHPDGRRFVAVRLRGDVTIHATQDGREMTTVGRGSPPVTFFSDGRQLMYRQDDSHMRILYSDDWTLPSKKAAFKAALRDVQQELNLTP